MGFVLSGFLDEAADDLYEQLRIAEYNDIRYIEMRGVNGRSISGHTPNEAKEIKKALDANGFRISSIGSPFGKVSIHDDFAPHLDQYRRCVELAHILGSKYLRLFSFYIPNNEPHEEYREQVMFRLAKFIDCSDGMIPVHENEKGIYGDSAERCRDIANTFGDKLPLVFDPANFIQCGVDVTRAYDLLEPYIEYLHVKDARYADGAVVPAGQGDGGLERILLSLMTKPGERFLTLEPHLKVFGGFSLLEENAKLNESPIYSSNEEAFNAAAAALKTLLRANGFLQSKNLETGHNVWTR